MKQTLSEAAVLFHQCGFFEGKIQQLFQNG
jgi:hypothetical protein